MWDTSNDPDTIKMTKDNFTSLNSLWTDEGIADGNDTDSASGTFTGEVYYDELVTNASVGTKIATSDSASAKTLLYFQRYKCGTLSSNEQTCMAYQLKDDETVWTDGNPRWEAGQRVRIYLISGVGFKEVYALMSSELILQGSETLLAGLALAAAAALAF